MSLHPAITDAQLAESPINCSQCGISEFALQKEGRQLLRCARCKVSIHNLTITFEATLIRMRLQSCLVDSILCTYDFQYFLGNLTSYANIQSVECQKEEWPTHKIKCLVNANTARSLAADPTKHPNLLSDFRAWLATVIRPIAWCSLNALEAKPKLRDLAKKAFFIELTHVPDAPTLKEKFVLKEYSVRPRSLAQAAVASDATIAREFEKMSGKSSVAATIIKAGALVKVIGFDASYEALAAHDHSDDWRPVLEKAIRGELQYSS